jgi:hypothetical protein
MGLGALTGGAGIAQMFGVSNPAVNALGAIDPFGAALNVGSSGFGLGGRLGLGMAGRMGIGAVAGAGAGALAMGGFEALRYGGNQFMGGFQQQQAVNAQLGQFDFANTGARTGRGFAPGQQRAIGAAMRGMDAADPFTTMADLTSTMQNFTDMGMMQGVRDSEEFSTKFKKMAETVKSMAMAMGTTMQDAAGAFGQMRQAGFFTAAEVMGNTTQMQFMKGMGMSPEQFSQMQTQGAGFARANQMAGQAGARAVTNIAGNLMMNPANERRMMDITGAGSMSEASAMMAQQVVGQGANFLNQTGPGAALLAAVGQTNAQGQFTGGISQDVLGQMAGGQVGLRDLSSMGQKNLQGKGRQSFMHRRKDITQGMMQQEDFIPAIMAVIEKEAQGDEDVEALLYERLMGMDRRTSEIMKEQTNKLVAIKQEKRRRIQEELATQAMQAEISRNRSFSGLMQKASGTLSDIASPIAQAGADLSYGVEAAGMNMSDQFFGIQRTRVTAGGLEEGAFATAAGQGGRFQAAQLTGTGQFATGVSSGRGIPFITDMTQGQELSTLSGAVARSQGTAAAGTGAAMAQFGTLTGARFDERGQRTGGGNIGTVLGISGSRQQKLQEVATGLRGDRELQNLIAQAQDARLAGDKSEVRRLRTRIDARIAVSRGKAGITTENGQAGTDQGIKDAAFVLGEMGASALVVEDFGREGGLATAMSFAEQDARAADDVAKEQFGTQWSSASRLLSTVGKAALPSVYGAGASLGAIGDILTGRAFTESKAQFIVEGGPGANVMAALEGKIDPKALGALKEKAKNAKDAEEGQRIMAEGLRKMAGRPDLTDEDLKAAGKYLSSTSDYKQIGEATRAAASKERGESAKLQSQAIATALSAERISGLEAEQIGLGEAARTGGGVGQAATALLRAAVEKGDIESMAASGPVGAQLAASTRGVRKVQERMGTDFSVEQMAKDLGESKDVIEREARRIGVSTEGLTEEAADKLAEHIGTSRVLGVAGAGVTGVSFKGGMDPQVQQMTMAQQIQRTAELLDAVDSKVTGRPTVSGQFVGQVMDNGDKQGVSSTDIEKLISAFGGS